MQTKEKHKGTHAAEIVLPDPRELISKVMRMKMATTMHLECFASQRITTIIQCRRQQLLTICLSYKIEMRVSKEPIEISFCIEDAPLPDQVYAYV